MKLTKLMLSASVAALALVACNKQDTAPETLKRLKTVEISLENVALTKGLAGPKIEAGDAVILNDFKIFLTDDSGNEYTAKLADGSADAQTYWSTVDLSSGAIKATSTPSQLPTTSLQHSSTTISTKATNLTSTQHASYGTVAWT